MDDINKIYLPQIPIETNETITEVDGLYDNRFLTIMKKIKIIKKKQEIILYLIYYQQIVIIMKEEVFINDYFPSKFLIMNVKQVLI